MNGLIFPPVLVPVSSVARGRRSGTPGPELIELAEPYPAVAVSVLPGTPAHRREN